MSTPEDYIMAAAENLASALQGKMRPHLQESSIRALERLQDIFNQTAPHPQPTRPTGKEVMTQEMHDTESQKDNTPSPPAHPPTQSPALPPRVEPLIHRRVPPPRLDPPPPPRVQPLRRSQLLATASLPKVPPARRTNVRENQAQSPAHNTRVKTRLQSSIHKSMISCVHVTQHRCTPENFARRRFPIQMHNAVLDDDTGELMEMIHLMKNPKYRELWGKSYGNELGCLEHGMPWQVEGTNTFF